jgi:hypothetical protein
MVRSPAHNQIGPAATNDSSAYARLGFSSDRPFLVWEGDLLQVLAIALWAAKFHSATITANCVKPDSARLVARTIPI